MKRLTFGVDLITFFDPAFWGVGDESAVIALGHAEPRMFWDRMLDELAATAIEGIELTFAPFDWRSTLVAYGSASAFADELARRGLRLSTGFFADVAIGGGLEDPARCQHYLDEADRYAAYLATLGVEVMVMGLPMRRSWDAEPPLFVDLDLGRTVGDFCNRLGAALLRHGVRLALHTEAHSIFCTSRDIDLLMLLTDPVYVGFCPDTAHITLAGSDPLAVVERHKDRVIATHWKDATGAAPRLQTIDATIHHKHRAYFCSLGGGIIDWPAWLRLLRTIGFDGPSILEIDAVPDPRGELIRSLAYVNDVLIPGVA